MNAFDEAVYKWERSIEDICIDMLRQKSSDGFALACDVTPMIDGFKLAVGDLRASMESGKITIIPGNRSNED